MQNNEPLHKDVQYLFVIYLEIHIKDKVNFIMKKELSKILNHLWYQQYHQEVFDYHF